MSRYSSQLKYMAMELWAEGRSDAAVGRELGSQGRVVSAATIGAWRKKKDPQNWDTFREKVQEIAKRESVRVLLSRQIDVHVQHFDDWNRIRVALLRSMSTPNKDPDTGKVVWVPRDMSTAELKAAAGTYREIQRGQRLALGIPADHVLTETSEAERMSDRANEVLEAVGLSNIDLESIGDHVAEKISRSRAKVIDIVPRDAVDETIDDITDES